MKKIHRFFYDFKIIDNIIKIDDTEIVNQIKNVLKIKPSEKISLFFDSKEVECIIKTIGKREIICNFYKNIEFKKQIKNVILYCAILKKDNFEFVVQKACEIGVSEIVPVITDRTIKTNLNLERLEKIAKEACEQSGRNDLVKINEIRDFAKCLNNDNDVNILFDFTDKKLQDSKIKGEKIGIFIGPEGGFTNREVKIAEENNFKILRLGDNVFKAETAAIIASYVVLNY